MIKEILKSKKELLILNVWNISQKQTTCNSIINQSLVKFAQEYKSLNSYLQWQPTTAHGNYLMRENYVSYTSLHGKAIQTDR